jgi:CheY-like chemotaxis protein
MLSKIKVLLIEDDEDTAFFEKAALSDYKDVKFEVTHTISLADSLKLIGKKFFDVILLDLILPNGAGLEVFNAVHKKCDDIPIVIVSGYEEHAIDAVQAGAQDYLIKPVNTIQLVTSINYAIERKKVEEECKKDYKQLLSIFDSMEEMIYVSDPETYEIIYMNESIKKLFGCSIGKQCYIIFGGIDFPCLECHNNEVFGENFGKTFTYDIKSGKNNRWYKSTIRAIKWPDSRLLRYTIAVDITEDKDKEERLSNFLEKKIDDFNIELAKSAKHYKKQIYRLEQLTSAMVTDGAI